MNSAIPIAEYEFGSNHIGLLPNGVFRIRFFPTSDYFFDLEEMNQLDTTQTSIRGPVFVVPGHDAEMKEKVKSALEEMGLETNTLAEKSSRRRTIIEKFTDDINNAFAIILLSPDDSGAVNKQPLIFQERAGQNVILEMGFFLGKLGARRVFVLYRNKIGLELLSEYSGVKYMNFDEAGDWEKELAQELKAAGYNMDANKLVRAS